jgi:NAD(P)-dependent dehydrogenase (short-subunit alcohol dehydrogenase family)
MTNKKIWFIAGASRGMGVDFAKATLAAGIPGGLNRSER